MKKQIECSHPQPVIVPGWSKKQTLWLASYRTLARTTIASTLVFLSLLSSGCSSTATVPQVQREPVPRIWTDPLPLPPLGPRSGSTSQELRSFSSSATPTE